MRMTPSTSLLLLLLVGVTGPHLSQGAIKVKTSHSHDGGFCAMKQSGHFPLPPPEPHIPWIWDATVVRSGRMVEATAISRNACRFDRKLWKKIVETYPQYAHQLGDGLESNIYAPVVPGYDYVRINSKGYKGERKRGLQMRTVVCVFLLDDKVVARESSLRILDVEIAELSTIQIRCPIPDNLRVKERSQLDKDAENISPVPTWDRMRIERRLSSNPDHGELNLPNSTEIFPVCNMHRLEMAMVQQTPGSCSYSNNTPCNKGAKRNKLGHSISHSYLYKLSLCTATSRSFRPQLVEWIEYHRLLGVEHFYIYDTNPYDTKLESTLGGILADYVHHGIVTVVRWPYENCVKNMGSGRKVHVTKPFHDIFMPPRAISQTGALASCYSRYKEFSEWMIHIDDDEFLGFSPTAKFGGVKAQNLYDLVSQLTKADPKTNAVSFYPLCITDCVSFENNKDNTSIARHILPRFGTWKKGKFCPYYETKLILRTAAIGMFFTHYITLREQPPLGAPFGNYNREPTQLSRRDAAVLHYKYIPDDLSKSGSVFGATLPFDPNTRRRDCMHPSEMRENVTAASVLNALTKLALPYLERKYTIHLTEINAFEI